MWSATAAISAAGQRTGGERLGVGVGRPGTGHRCARVRGDGAVHHRHVEDAAQRLERVLDRRTKTAQHINCSRDAPPNSRDRRITRVRYGAIGSFGRAAGTKTGRVR